MALKKIKLPDNTVVDVQDSRIPAAQSTDNGKVLGVTNTSGTLGWVEQSGGTTAVTWSELKALRDAGTLQAGEYYRITDYVATTTQADTQSANHPFDIIVRAITGSTLSEEGCAAIHSGDTYFTSAGANLAAWKVWYTIDNDTTRFSWADATNGKGVVYRLIDEWDNDLPYDFKGIQFKRYYVASVQHTSLSPLVGLPIARSGYKGITIDSSSYKWYYTFSLLGNTWDDPVSDASFNANTVNVVFAMGEKTDAYNNHTELLDNTFLRGKVVYDFLIQQAGSTGTYSQKTHFVDIRITGADCVHNTFVGWTGLFTTQSTFRRNLIVADFRHQRIGTNFQDNTIFAPNDYAFVDYGQSFSNNIISVTKVGGGSFGCYFQNNVMEGSNLANFKFGHYVAYNTFSDLYFNSVEINGQFTYCAFSGKFLACTFNNICGYVDFVGGSNGNACVGLDVVGSIRGTASARVTISNSVFIRPNASGVNRRIRLEGDTNENLVATWYSAGKRVGITKAAADADWTTLPAIAYTSDIPSVPVTDVTYDGTSVVSNGTAVIPKDIFWATYGSTTSAQIEAAYQAGKMVCVFWNNRVYTLIYRSSATGHTFGYVWGTTTYRVVCTSNAWTNTSVALQNTEDKVSTLTGYESNTSKYPNTKAVYDAIAALPSPMVFKGTIGTGGTSTTVPSSPTEGDTYKIISGGESLTFSGISDPIKVGDTVIYKNSTTGWVLIPSGDEPSGTVTNVTAGAGLNTTGDDSGTDGGSITSSGSINLTKSGVTAGTYQGLTVDKYGRVTAASDEGYYKKPNTGIPASDIASGVIPAAVEANPTVPSGTTPTSLTGLKIDTSYYSVGGSYTAMTNIEIDNTVNTAWV